MKAMVLSIGVAVMVQLLGVVSSAQTRTFQDSTGKFSVTAEIVEIKGDAVVLKKQGGETIEVPIDSFFLSDQAYLQELRVLKGLLDARGPVTVTRANGFAIRGILLSVSPSSVRIRSQTRPLKLPLADVKSITTNNDTYIYNRSMGRFESKKEQDAEREKREREVRIEELKEELKKELSPVLWSHTITPTKEKLHGAWVHGKYSDGFEGFYFKADGHVKFECQRDYGIKWADGGSHAAQKVRHGGETWEIEDEMLVAAKLNLLDARYEKIAKMEVFFIMVEYGHDQYLITHEKGGRCRWYPSKPGSRWVE